MCKVMHIHNKFRKYELKQIKNKTYMKPNFTLRPNYSMFGFQFENL